MYINRDMQVTVKWRMKMEKFIHLFVWIEIYKVDKQKIKMFGEYKYEKIRIMHIVQSPGGVERFIKAFKIH